eukprot:TRINITY_DN10421_c0_g1_i1.p3 TRINITY_DN10421_c0_g1~~TRINITY_DN10421_c0_g1_i1.p3  ORF type:complete len:177 (-),score=39.18 TRINITY_DN10421_c0_g1_i1:19-549(-)
MEMVIKEEIINGVVKDKIINGVDKDKIIWEVIINGEDKEVNNLVDSNNGEVNNNNLVGNSNGEDKVKEIWEVSNNGVDKITWEDNSSGEDRTIWVVSSNGEAKAWVATCKVEINGEEIMVDISSNNPTWVWESCKMLCKACNKVWEVVINSKEWEEICKEETNGEVKEVMENTDFL